MLGAVDATQAIADLTEISPQVRHVVVLGADGAVAGSNLGDTARADRLAAGARRLLETAEELRPGVAQLEAATPRWLRLGRNLKTVTMPSRPTGTSSTSSTAQQLHLMRCRPNANSTRREN